MINQYNTYLSTYLLIVYQYISHHRIDSVSKHSLTPPKMTHTTLASDALILAAGALTVTAAAIVTATPPFKTSLGTEGDDDSLCAPESESPDIKEHTTATTEDSKPPVHPASEQAALKPGAVEKKAVTSVTVEEVPSTPDAVDVRVQDSMFAAS